MDARVCSEGHICTRGAFGGRTDITGTEVVPNFAEVSGTGIEYRY